MFDTRCKKCVGEDGDVVVHISQQRTASAASKHNEGTQPASGPAATDAIRQTGRTVVSVEIIYCRSTANGGAHCTAC